MFLLAVILALVLRGGCSCTGSAWSWGSSFSTGAAGVVSDNCAGAGAFGGSASGVVTSDWLDVVSVSGWLLSGGSACGLWQALRDRSNASNRAARAFLTFPSRQTESGAGEIPIPHMSAFMVGFAAGIGEAQVF